MHRPAKLVTTIVVAVVALAVVAGLVVWSVPVFRVSQIEVTGNRVLSTEEVEEASGISKGENLLQVDVKEAASHIADLPWAASATVSRSFPSTVSVELTEHEPVAYVEGNGEKKLIDAEGEIFTTGEPPEEAVEITGETGDPDAQRKDKDTAEARTPEMKEAVEVLAALPDSVRAQVRSLDIEERYSMRLHLKDDRSVYWGASEDNADKARATAAALQLEGQSFNVSNPELIGAR